MLVLCFAVQSIWEMPREFLILSTSVIALQNPVYNLLFARNVLKDTIFEIAIII